MSSSVSNVEARLAAHDAFWKRSPVSHPLAAFRIVPDFFFSRHFEAARTLLVPGRRIEAADLDVDRFLADYERMFAEAESLGQDAFWTAEPFTGIPWMEACLGCPVYAGAESFITHPKASSLDELEAVEFDEAGPWARKYLEFIDKLVALSRGRFPVGMPIMRGPSDAVGALLGQTEMVLAMADEPDRMKAVFLKAARAQTRLLELQTARIPAFRGGSALGFYHVWAPGSSGWYQEDLSAIMSPALYRDFLAAPERLLCAGKEHTAIHLHPASFFILDELLAKDDLKAIEVNKDVGGPSVAEMLPQLKRIQERKSLILWGDLTLAEIDLLSRELDAAGLFLHVLAPDRGRAEALLARIRKWKA